MLYKIADFIVDVPTAGGLASRCEKYEKAEISLADIIIREEDYCLDRLKGASEDIVAYMESAYQFYLGLIKHGGIYLHSSAIELDGKAYLFSGPSGVGKSTHTRLWREVFGGR